MSDLSVVTVYRDIYERLERMDFVAQTNAAKAMGVISAYRSGHVQPAQMADQIQQLMALILERDLLASEVNQ